MKRRMLALLLAVLTLTMLTAAAFAEDTEVLGVYNVTGPLTVKNGTKDGGFYAGADTFELNCTGLTGSSRATVPSPQKATSSTSTRRA